eukprot:c20822_g1_i1.p1 GENE.c20822_g1_i1~~c20822_g1_i1.p1  ORF type:complete len:528 (-),score=69.43 c20822_g1_i1:194-1723(-)
MTEEIPLAPASSSTYASISNASPSPHQIQSGSIVLPERSGYNGYSIPKGAHRPSMDDHPSPFMTPKGILQSQLYNHDPTTLQTHPYYYSEWQQGRNMSMPSAVFNLVCTIIGGGVLSLPYVMRKAGIAMGIILVIIMAVTCDWSIYILISCSRRTGATSYKEVTEIAFGKSAGVVVTASIFALTYLSMIAYGILLRDVVTAIVQCMGFISDDPSMSTQNLTMLFCIILVFPLCTFKTLNALRFTSAFSICAVSTLACCLTYHTIKAHTSGKSQREISKEIQYWPASFWDCLYVFSITCVAFVCHFNVPPIHSDLVVPSRARIKRVIHTTMAICSFMYCFIGLAGYLIFFDDTQDNIFLNFSSTDPAITVGRCALTISMLMSFPLLTLPCRDSFHSLLMSTRQAVRPLSQSSSLAPQEASPFLRFCETVFLVASAYLISASVATVAVVWNFLGSTVGILVACVFPAALYVRVRQPRIKSSMTVPAWVLLIFGMIALVMCTCEAIRSAMNK